MAEQPDAPEGFVYVDGEQMAERTAAVNGLLQSNGGKTIPAIIRSNAAGQQPGAQTRTIQPSKTLFRSGEPMSCKYDVTGIDAEKCLRAAITGDYSKLTDAEKRSVTPSTGGAMLAPEVSALIIDNLRQVDWITAIQPTFVSMETAEMKIPNITALPTAVMHTPGTEETSTDPTITAVTLSAKTIMTVVEVANELLQDAATSQGVILQAATDAIANKLLQQVMYGTGVAPEFRGVTLYSAGGFAASGSQAVEKDLFSWRPEPKPPFSKRTVRLTPCCTTRTLRNGLTSGCPPANLWSRPEPSQSFTMPGG